MSDRTILLQYVMNERHKTPKGQRIWSDGLVQRCATTNPGPDMSINLERDRDLIWEDDRTLSADQVNQVKDAIVETGFFTLEPRLLINYCKDDPPTMIWTANVDGRTWRVVVYDPRPKRSDELDQLSLRLNQILAH